MSLFTFEHYLHLNIIFRQESYLKREKNLDLRPYLQPEGKTLLVISKSLHQRRPEIVAATGRGGQAG